MKSRAADQVRLASDAYTKHNFNLAFKAAQRTVQVWPLSSYAPEAQYLLSRLYATGHGVAKDVEQADLCLAAAERGGNLSAQMLRSAARQSALDNPESAFKPVRQKAAEGEVKSQLVEGILYALGEGTPKDLNAARKSLQNAAQQGNPEAQYFLGRVFLIQDEETRPDRDMGLRWLTRAASQGYAPAQETLGELSPVVANSESWFLKAAEQGNSRAQEKLGLLYALRSEGSTNKVSACLWLSLAADAGHSTARAWLQKISQELSPAQTAELARLRLEFKARHRTEGTLQNGEALFHYIGLMAASDSGEPPPSPLLMNGLSRSRIPAETASRRGREPS